jgi:hypothetical protein
MLKCLVFSLWFFFHPVHVTLTSIEYVPEKDSLKVFVKMYFDDFLLDIGMNKEKSSAISFSSDDLKARETLEKYLNRKLNIEVNKKLLTGKINDLEIVDNEVKLNLEYSKVRSPEIIFVRNLIMTDLYKDQSNMMIIKVKDFEEGIKLTSDLTEKTFNIR